MLSAAVVIGAFRVNSGLGLAVDKEYIEDLTQVVISYEIYKFHMK